MVAFVVSLQACVLMSVSNKFKTHSVVSHRIKVRGRASLQHRNSSVLPVGGNGTLSPESKAIEVVNSSRQLWMFKITLVALKHVVVTCTSCTITRGIARIFCATPLVIRTNTKPVSCQWKSTSSAPVFTSEPIFVGSSHFQIPGVGK